MARASCGRSAIRRTRRAGTHPPHPARPPVPRKPDPYKGDHRRPSRVRSQDCLPSVRSTRSARPRKPTEPTVRFETPAGVGTTTVFVRPRPCLNTPGCREKPSLKRSLITPPLGGGGNAPGPVEFRRSSPRNPYRGDRGRWTGQTRFGGVLVRDRRTGARNRQAAGTHFPVQRDFVSSGFTQEEHRRFIDCPDGPKLSAHLRDFSGSVRLSDLPALLRPHGFRTPLPARIQEGHG